MNRDTLQQLYRWAGSNDHKAAIYLLATACNGHFLETAVRSNEHGEPHLDATRVQPQGWESGSEARILAIAHSLLTGDTIDLSWAIENHDDTNANAITHAIAIATGSATHPTT